MHGFELRLPFCLQLIVIFALFSQACGLPIKAFSTPCGSGTAQIDVYENFILRTCGCREGNGGNFRGQTLNCTVARGTQIFFSYPNITGPHQVVVGPGATGTPLYHNPQSGPQTNPVDVITLNSTSSGISFIDQYTTNGGTFIVQ